MLFNFYENILIDKEKEEYKDILKSKDLRIERIVSNGQVSQKDFWYIQDENEFVMLLEGLAILEFDDEEITLKKGDCYNIVSKRKHRVKYTDINSPTIWLAVFYK